MLPCDTIIQSRWGNGSREKSHDVKHVYCPPRRDDGNSIFSLNAVCLKKEENRRSNSPAKQTSIQQSSSPPRAVQDSDQQGSNHRGQMGSRAWSLTLPEHRSLGSYTHPSSKTISMGCLLCFWRVSDHILYIRVTCR